MSLRSVPLIGIVGPFSGPRACYGDLLKHTIEETLLPNFADLIFEDDEANPQRAELIAKSLKQKNPLGIIGHFNSQSAAAGGKIYAEANIPLLLPASTAPNLTQLPTTFRLCANDLDQGLAIIQFISKQKFRHAAIWNDGSAYSLSILECIYKFSDNRWIDAKDVQKDDLLILLGAHHNIIDYLLSRKHELEDTILVCCDDCSISEFIESTTRFNKIWIATSKPNFRTCIQNSAELIIQFLQRKINMSLLYWLKDETYFVKQQNKLACFELAKY